MKIHLLFQIVLCNFEYSNFIRNMLRFFPYIMIYIFLYRLINSSLFLVNTLSVKMSSKIDGLPCYFCLFIYFFIFYKSQELHNVIWPRFAVLLLIFIGARAWKLSSWDTQFNHTPLTSASPGCFKWLPRSRLAVLVCLSRLCLKPDSF